MPNDTFHNAIIADWVNKYAPLLDSYDTLICLDCNHTYPGNTGNDSYFTCLQCFAKTTITQLANGTHQKR